MNTSTSSVKSTMANAPPSCQLLWYCKQSYDCTAETFMPWGQHSAPWRMQFPFLSVEVYAALETLLASATPTSVLSVQHTLQPLTRVKLIFYMQHPAWKLPRDLGWFPTIAWAGCVCIITATAIILELCKSEQTLSYGKTHSWFFCIGNKQ